MQPKINYDNIVYVSHPYSGNDNNADIVTDLIRALQDEFPTYLFLSPIHAFSHLYDYVSYQDGLNMCLWLLDNADEMWVFGNYENSVGCMAEIAYCQNHLIPYRIMDMPCKYQGYTTKDCIECGLSNLDEEWVACNKVKISHLYGEVTDE